MHYAYTHICIHNLCMYICVYAYCFLLNTYIYTYIHTHTYIHTYIHAYIHTHTYIHTCMGITLYLGKLKEYHRIIMTMKGNTRRMTYITRCLSLTPLTCKDTLTTLTNIPASGSATIPLHSFSN